MTTTAVCDYIYIRPFACSDGCPICAALGIRFSLFKALVGFLFLTNRAANLVSIQRFRLSWEGMLGSD